MNELAITNVSQKKIHDHRVDLFFEINSIRYSMMAISFFRKKAYRPFEPQFVFHDSTEPCPQCASDNPGIRCPYLESIIDEVFVKLVNMPSIRLEWVHLPYTERKIENGS